MLRYNILIIVFSVLTIFCLYSLCSYYINLNNVYKVEGSVVSVTKERDLTYHRSLIYIDVPTIAFLTKSGQSIIFKDCNSCNSNLKVGDKVPVAYDKNHPKDAYVDNGRALHLLYVYTIAFSAGLIFVVYARSKTIKRKGLV